MADRNKNNKDKLRCKPTKPVVIESKQIGVEPQYEMGDSVRQVGELADIMGEIDFSNRTRAPHSSTASVIVRIDHDSSPEPESSSSNNTNTGGDICVLETFDDHYAHTVDEAVGGKDSSVESQGFTMIDKPSPEKAPQRSSDASTEVLLVDSLKDSLDHVDGRNNGNGDVCKATNGNGHHPTMTSGTDSDVEVLNSDSDWSAAGEMRDETLLHRNLDEDDDDVLPPLIPFVTPPPPLEIPKRLGQQRPLPPIPPIDINDAHLLRLTRPALVTLLSESNRRIHQLETRLQRHRDAQRSLFALVELLRAEFVDEDAKPAVKK